MNKIAIFASGNGTNAENIIKYFQNSELANVEFVFCNNPKAYVIQRAYKLQIPTIVFTKKDFYQTDKILKLLKQNDIDFIVLAGFLWLVPKNIIDAYKNRIVNIHPALLPKFGGKGMYGDNVHKAVLEAGEKESGITIHYVDEKYDHGKIIFQAKCPVYPDDTVESLAKRVHKLEYEYYPKVIEQLLKELSSKE